MTDPRVGDLVYFTGGNWISGVARMEPYHFIVLEANYQTKFIRLSSPGGCHTTEHVDVFRFLLTNKTYTIVQRLEIK